MDARIPLTPRPFVIHNSGNAHHIHLHFIYAHHSSGCFLKRYLNEQCMIIINNVSLMFVKESFHGDLKLWKLKVLPKFVSDRYNCTYTYYYFVSAVSFPVVTPSGQRLTVLSKSLMGLTTSAATVNKVVGSVVTTSSGTSGRPVMRVPPLNVTGSQGQIPAGNGQSPQQSIRCGIVTRHAQKESEKAQTKERPKSEFHLVFII